MSMTFWQQRRRKARRLKDEQERMAARAGNLDDMTVKELKEYAKDKGVDLGEARKKDEIIAAITGTPKSEETPKPEEPIEEGGDE